MELMQSQSIFFQHTITLNDLFSYWIFTKEKEGVKVRTIERYVCNFNNYIKDTIGYLDIKEFTRTTIVTFLDSLRTIKTKKHVGLSDASINNIYVTLHSCFEFAIYHELLQTNPAVYIKQCKPRQKVVEVLNKQERIVLERYLLEEFNPENMGLYIMLYTGIRLGEMAALKWENVDLENRMIKIVETMNITKNEDSGKWDYYIESPKTNSSIRNIPIPNHLVEIFKKISEFRISSPFVIAKMNGDIMQPRLYRARFASILNKLGIRQRKIHALRHTFASQMIEQGMDMNTLSLILGHSAVEVTINIYVHSSIDRQRRLVNSIPFISEAYTDDDF